MVVLSGGGGWLLLIDRHPLRAGSTNARSKAKRMGEILRLAGHGGKQAAPIKAASLSDFPPQILPSRKCATVRVARQAASARGRSRRRFRPTSAVPAKSPYRQTRRPSASAIGECDLVRIHFPVSTAPPMPGDGVWPPGRRWFG